MEPPIVFQFCVVWTFVLVMWLCWRCWQRDTTPWNQVKLSKIKCIVHFITFIKQSCQICRNK